MDDSRQSIRVLMAGVACIIVLMFSLLYLALSHDTQLRETEDKLHTINEKTELSQVMREAIRKRSSSLAAITKMTDFFERDAEEQRFKSAARDFITAREKLYSLGIGNEEQAILDSFQNAVREGQGFIDKTMRNLVEGLPIEKAENLALQAIALQTRQFDSLDQFVDLLKIFSLEQLETTRQESEMERQLLVIIGSLLLLSGVVIAILIVRRERQHLIAMRTEISERKKAEDRVRELNASLEKRVEDRTNELSKSEERFSLVMRGANDGLWDWNLKTNDLYLSPRWCRMLGYEREELEPTLETWTSLVDPHDRDRALKEVQDYISGDADAFESEFRMRHKNGSWVSVLSRAFLVHENGEPVRLVGTHVDITRRKKTERELDFQKFALDEHAIVSIANNKGDITYVNDKFCYISGYPREELLGQNHRILKSSEHSQKFYEELWRTIASGKPWHGEIKNLKKGGGYYWVKATIVPFLNEQGKPFQYVAIRTDVTKRKRAEESAQKAYGQLSDAIESITDGVILLDAEDRFVLCNAKYRADHKPIERLLIPGTQFEEIINALAEHGIALGAVDNVEDWVQMRMEQHRTLSPHKPRQEIGGRWIMVHEYRTREGGTFVLRTDITEIKETQDDLIMAKDIAEAANRSKDEFLANMSHELRTPLNAIIGFSDSMRHETYGPLGNEKYKGYLEDIHGSGKHLLELINDILDVSAIEAGKLDLHEENMDVGKVIESAMKLIMGRAHEGNIRITSNTDDDLPMLHADKRRLMQILLNLLSNAVKFTLPGGEVTLTASLEGGDTHVFTVTDTGLGMDEEELIMAMSRFGQVDSGLDRKHEGSGLGLPLSIGLAELHGGTLMLESKKGKGTTVIVRFPAERTIVS